VAGPFIHHIDPIIGSVAGVHLWWYGLAYSLGFLTIYLALRAKREELGFTMRMVYDLSILVAIGVLIGGRFIEVVFYEWPFYSEHVHLMPAYWLGGMATHGLLLGGMVAVVLFCKIHRLPVLVLTDALAVPTAFILGFGRIGNFIDGQIVGSPTDAWWGVQFPDAEGFRHPVVLYDGIKNFLLVPVLLYIKRLRLAPGAATGLFLFLYALLRVFIDFFREYPTTLLGLATGQVLNVAMSAGGLALFAWTVARGRSRSASVALEVGSCRAQSMPTGGVAWRQALFAALLVLVLVIPSDWTQDIPDRYGKRHPGLRHSALYPAINKLSAP
jgi:phosphatidylglycerol:prolipoprotein diacylglycerol transferase